MFKDDKFEHGNIIRMHLVFSRLSNEVLLLAASYRVAFNRIASYPNLIIQLRQVDNDQIVVVFKK